MNPELPQQELRRNEMTAPEIADISLDALLRRTLQREDAPAGFAERVLAEATRRQAGASSASASARRRTFAMPGLRFAAAAAVLVAASVGVRYHAEQQERAQGEAARNKVMLALRITSNKLHQVQMHVSQMSTDDSTN